MDDKAWEKDIFKKFKSRGWSVTSAAIKGILSVLAKEEENKAAVLEGIINDISERMDKRQIKDSVIGEELIKVVCASLSTDDGDLALRKFKLIDPFAQPRISFDPTQKS